MSSIRKTLVLVSVLMVSGACGTEHITKAKIDGPDLMEPGKAAGLSAQGSFDTDASFTWTASAGGFDGSADHRTVTYIAPDPPPQGGTVNVVCTIKDSSGTIPLIHSIRISAISPFNQEPAIQEAPKVDMAHLAVVAPYNLDDNEFIPAGFMGDATQNDSHGRPCVRVEVSRERPHSADTCWRFEYRPGPVGWAAIAWQFPEGNFGDNPGKNLSNRGFRQVSIWARAIPDRRGDLPKVQFKAGGTTDPNKKYKASFAVAGPFVTLTQDWKQYTLDISSMDLSQVIAGFVLVIKALDVGAEGATLFLDDIEYR
jgi:hypothetical protein